MAWSGLVRCWCRSSTNLRKRWDCTAALDPQLRGYGVGSGPALRSVHSAAPPRIQLVSAFGCHGGKEPGFPTPLGGDLRLALPGSNCQPREIRCATCSGLHAHGPEQWNAENIGLELQQQIIGSSPAINA